MYRIRFHGRGGEGMKTASRITGTAFFLQGYEVQDAPRYGAERRGAPVFAYVRASRTRINERGIIRTPDLVVVADESLFTVQSAGLFEGVTPQTAILVNTGNSVDSLKTTVKHDRMITIPQPGSGHAAAASTLCAAASLRLSGVISRANLEKAIRVELAGLDPASVDENVRTGLEVFDGMGRFAGQLRESPDVSTEQISSAGWIDLPLHDSYRSAPSIRRPRTARFNPTGSWRTVRPVIDPAKCSRCMLCALYCPDSVISADDEGMPVIDYGHCKACMICESVCPVHAVSRIPEHNAQESKS